MLLITVAGAQASTTTALDQAEMNQRTNACSRHHKRSGGCALFSPVPQLDHGGRFFNERLNQLNSDGRHGPDSADPAHNWPARELYFSK
jgi:hypothetical protein